MDNGKSRRWNRERIFFVIHFQFSIIHYSVGFFVCHCRRLFVGVRGAQDGCFVEMFADDLQSDRHVVAVKAAG